MPPGSGVFTTPPWWRIKSTPPIRPLIDWLDYNGYSMVTKPTKEFTDSMGRRKIKGNMDLELAVDMMEMAERLDHVVLFSGDGDFRCLIESVQRRGVRATVISSIRSSPPMIADELRRQADNFIDLGDLQTSIERQLPADHPRQRERQERTSQQRAAEPSAAELDEEADETYDDE